jgi:hypothetical protein
MTSVWYCDGCRRWVLFSHSRCPFCPPRSSTVSAAPICLGLLLALGALVAGCDDDDDDDPSGWEDSGSTGYDSGYTSLPDAAAASYATAATLTDGWNSSSTTCDANCDGDTTGAESTTGDSGDGGSSGSSDDCSSGSSDGGSSGSSDGSSDGATDHPR